MFLRLSRAEGETCGSSKVTTRGLAAAVLASAYHLPRLLATTKSRPSRTRALLPRRATAEPLEPEIEPQIQPQPKQKHS